MTETNSNHDVNIDDINMRGDKVWSEKNEEKFITLLKEDVWKEIGPQSP